MAQSGVRRPAATIRVKNVACDLSLISAALVEAFRTEFGSNLVSLVLYGSYARGDARDDSDVDVIVVLRRIPDRDELHTRLDRVEERFARACPAPLSPIVLDVESATRFRPIYIDAAFDALVLYDEGGMMATVLSMVRRRLSELGARRVRIGRKWVVDLKPDYRPGQLVRLEM